MPARIMSSRYAEAPFARNLLIGKKKESAELLKTHRSVPATPFVPGAQRPMHERSDTSAASVTLEDSGGACLTESHR
jgi:hypothetical protein